MNQLILPLETKSLLNFEHFYPGDNALSVASLRHWPATEWFIFLQGPAGSGKTHLAEAMATEMLAQGRKVLYLTAKHPGFYESLAHLDFADDLIIDDFETLWPALPQQEEALFAFYNLCLEQKSPRLLLLSQKKVPDLGIHLKDLASRLQNGLSLNLKPLNDQGLRTVLFLHATRLGLHVGQEILDYLLHHRPRSAPILIADLQQLAQASLQDQRRITLPYAKQIFNTPPG